MAFLGKVVVNKPVVLWFQQVMLSVKLGDFLDRKNRYASSIY